MTARQRVYMDLASQGRSLEEIAAITHRSMHAVTHALRLAASKYCESPDNCRSCPLRTDCEARSRLVHRLLRGGGNNGCSGPSEQS